jgi:hypothetical protein
MEIQHSEDEDEDENEDDWDRTFKNLSKNSRPRNGYPVHHVAPGRSDLLRKPVAKNIPLMDNG